MTLQQANPMASLYSFCGVTLDLSAERLTRGDGEVKLRPKSFQVLRYLAERAGRLVTREELLAAVWPDVVVTDESITKCVADIRRALGSDVIRTVARRGYVFTAPITHTVAFARDPHTTHAHDLVDLSTSGGAGPRTAGRSIGRAWIAALGSLVAITALTIVIVRASHATSRGTAAFDYSPITNFTNAASSPALSPDGRMLTFIRGDIPGTIGGPGDIFVKLLPDGEPVQLTYDGGVKIAPTFTPDGTHITYGISSVMTDPHTWAVWSVPIFGGPPALLMSNASAWSWLSPRQALFSRIDAVVHMSIVTAAEDGTAMRTVYAPAPANGMAHRSFISPDRRHVLVVEMDHGWLPCRVVPFERDASPTVGTGDLQIVGPSPGQCSSGAWSPDGRWVYLSVNTGAGYHIWRQRFPGGVPEQVTFGASEEQDVAFAPDGRSFLTSAGTHQSTLWVHNERGDRQITFEGYATVPRFSRDRKTLYYLLQSGANRRYVSGELWAANLETGARERLFRNFLLADYNLSRDGRRIVLVAIAPDGDTRVWLASLDGRTPPRALPAPRADRAFFGRDGEILFFGGDGHGARYLSRIRENGTGIEQAVARPLSYVYDTSPDGLAAATWSGGAVQIVRLDGSDAVDASFLCAAAGGDTRGTTPPCVSWSPDGAFWYLFDRVDGQLFTVPLPRSRTVPDLPQGGITSAAQAAALRGARTIHVATAFGGPDADVYAFFRVSTQRNIYRVRIP